MGDKREGRHKKGHMGGVIIFQKWETIDNAQDQKLRGRNISTQFEATWLSKPKIIIIITVKFENTCLLEKDNSCSDMEDQYFS